MSLCNGRAHREIDWECSYQVLVPVETEITARFLEQARRFIE